VIPKVCSAASIGRAQRSFQQGSPRHIDARARGQDRDARTDLGTGSRTFAAVDEAANYSGTRRTAHGSASLATRLRVQRRGCDREQLIVDHDVGELHHQARRAGDIAGLAGGGDNTVHEGAAGSHCNAVDDDGALELAAKPVARAMLARIDAFDGANDQPRACRHRDVGRLYGGLRSGGLYATAEIHADNLVFRKGLDVVAGIEHDDAIATADEIALEHGAIGEFERIGQQGCAEYGRQNCCRYSGRSSYEYCLEHGVTQGADGPFSIPDRKLVSHPFVLSL